MTGLLAISIFVFAPALILYFYCYYGLHRVIAEKRPEWLEHKGFFGRKHSPTNANVVGQVLGIAFTKRAKELSTPAWGYALALRILLPIYVCAFGVILWFVIAAIEP